jgi:hypothetical protein
LRRISVSSIKLTHFLCALVMSVSLAACGGGSGPAVRVLFVGNSHTAFNDLAGVVQELVGAADLNADVTAHAPGGWWLRDHAASRETIALISDGDWDFVVLQEQSMAPAVSDMARDVSYPAALQLSTLAAGNGAEVVLFMTWGHLAGSPGIGYATFESMQTAIALTYLEFGDALRAEVAPVGAAWWLSLSERPDISLFDPDGTHPGVEGTFLAAAVLTATMFDVDAESLGDAGGVEGDIAEALRGFAARAVEGETPWRP